MPSGYHIGQCESGRRGCPNHVWQPRPGRIQSVSPHLREQVFIILEHCSTDTSMDSVFTSMNSVHRPWDFDNQGEHLGPLNTDGYFQFQHVRALHRHQMTVPGVSQDTLHARLPVCATEAPYSNFGLSDLFGLSSLYD